MATKYRSYTELPLVLTVEDLMPVLLIGRNAAYELVKKYLETMAARETQRRST